MNMNALTTAQRTKLEAAVVKARSDGMKMADIQAKFKLNHSQAELILIRASLTDDDYNRFAEGGATLKDQVITARKAGTSWGVIGVLAGEPESKVRKLWAEGTGLKSQGLRIGRGGRFYYRDEVLYEDTLKPTGTEIKVGSNHEQARVAARTQRLFRLDTDQLRDLGAAYGLNFKGRTKAQMAKAILAEATKRDGYSEAELVELAS